MSYKKHTFYDLKEFKRPMNKVDIGLWCGLGCTFGFLCGVFDMHWLAMIILMMITFVIFFITLMASCTLCSKWINLRLAAIANELEKDGLHIHSWRLQGFDNLSDYWITPNTSPAPIDNMIYYNSRGACYTLFWLLMWKYGKIDAVKLESKWLNETNKEKITKSFEVKRGN